VSGPRRGRGDPVSAFFSSRWVQRPGHVAELGDGLAGALDVGLVVSDEPATSSAARFTRSGTQSAPVLLCLDRCRLEGIRAVVVNSGNANAATGISGLEDAASMQQAAARAGGVADEEVAVASTGVIGVPLPMEAVLLGIEAAGGALRGSGDGAVQLAEAIRTTDAYSKHTCLGVELSGGSVTISAQAKGAGMISPSFATLLCFVQSDAVLSPETCDLLLGVTVKRSFERVSVDGQLSTSDTVILQASGASGVRVEPETDDELRFGEALDALLRQLALEIVADGEGARRVGRLVVRGGDQPAVERVARAVGGSPLVKTALYGGDPNWGRIVQAVGMAMAGTAPLAVDVAIEGVQVCSRGAFVPHDARALAQAVAGDEVELEVGLPGEGAEAELFFSDLGHEYVTITADYTT
jgi:glutamate N-acetyltransferase/amino-acid N-acetyltransferase